MNNRTAANAVEYLLTVDTPTLVNAVELLKMRPNREGFTPVGLRCLFPEMGRLCGYAVTAQVETISRTEPLDMQGFLELYRLVEASPKPAVVVLQEIGGYADYAAHCGEVMATFFTRLGAVGLVSDCAVRDIPEVRALGFKYFARGAVASHGNFRIVRSGLPVQILGMEVKPGTILHGDENGLITVPGVPIDQIEAHVIEIRSREKKIMDFVKSEHFTLDGFRDLVVE
ncbi:MAG: RraA family protein [Bryobacterales bacterium]|nr:RraA family protein [Bryobacterales bacterium]